MESRKTGPRWMFGLFSYLFRFLRYQGVGVFTYFSPIFTLLTIRSPEVSLTLSVNRNTLYVHVRFALYWGGMTTRVGGLVGVFVRGQTLIFAISTDHADPSFFFYGSFTGRTETMYGTYDDFFYALTYDDGNGLVTFHV